MHIIAHYASSDPKKLRWSHKVPLLPLVVAFFSPFFSVTNITHKRNDRQNLRVSWFNIFRVLIKKLKTGERK